jgi:26S proteasome regulatory subunit T3
MAAVAVMQPKAMTTAMQVDTDKSDAETEDLYTRLKSLQRQQEFLEIQASVWHVPGILINLHPLEQHAHAPLSHLQEEYIKEEQKNLKRELLRAQEEIKRIQAVPLVIGQFLEMVDANTGIVGSTTGSNYYVRILSTLNRELLKPSASVALHRHSNNLVEILPPEADSSISLLGDNEKPNITYQVCVPASPQL